MDRGRGKGVPRGRKEESLGEGVKWWCEGEQRV